MQLHFLSFTKFRTNLLTFSDMLKFLKITTTKSMILIFFKFTPYHYKKFIQQQGFVFKFPNEAQKGTDINPTTLNISKNSTL